MPGFGADFKRRVREETQTTLILAGFGEMLPNFDNRVTVDDNVRDAWDIPVAHIDCRTGDNERAMAQDMMDEAREMLTAAGADITGSMTFYPPPGYAIHECGTARMGHDPKTSFLNAFNQSHDVKNLFVCDGSAFVSIANQNPTLTMMALTARACDYLVEEHRRGNLA
jgi:choline dehydrogenase-like flavoprotein